MTTSWQAGEVQWRNESECHKAMFDAACHELRDATWEDLRERVFDHTEYVNVGIAGAARLWAQS